MALYKSKKDTFSELFNAFLLHTSVMYNHRTYTLEQLITMYAKH